MPRVDDRLRVSDGEVYSSSSAGRKSQSPAHDLVTSAINSLNLLFLLSLLQSAHCAPQIMSLGQNTGPLAGVTPTTPASDRPTVEPGGVGDLRGDTGLLGGNTPDPPPNADSALVPNPELVNGQEAEARLGLFLDLNGVDAPQPIRGEGGQTDPGPRTYDYEKLNPDTYAPPGTDAGSVPQNMWNMGMSHNRFGTGRRSGFARQTNSDVLPVEAGVDMRLAPNAYREVHWHTANKWSLMLKGCVRLAAVNEDGKNFVDDALGEGAEFLLVLDEGDFNEDATFLASELFLRNPIEVLSKNFKANVSAFDHLPSDQLYIFNGTPAPANITEQEIAAPNGTVKGTLSSYTYHCNFAAALVVIHPGAMRELHWHTLSDEYAYFIQGTGRITVFTAPEASRTFDFTPNGVGYIPHAASHYIENTGTEDLIYLEVLQSHRFTDISVAQWLALSPRQMVKDTLHLPDEVIDRLPRSKEYVIAGNTNLTALAGAGKARTAYVNATDEVCEGEKYGAHIVTSNWLTACVNFNRRVDEKPYRFDVKPKDMYNDFLDFQRRYPHQKKPKQEEGGSNARMREKENRAKMDRIAQSSTPRRLVEAILNAPEEDVAAIVSKIRTCDSLDTVAGDIMGEDFHNKEEEDRQGSPRAKKRKTN
ncbi:RmlC-like cupin domain-containing protein [Coniochaeta sp. 2T2.1]|nr:RmlC-like cupin domain-containing protein [Coniochaeta sp. 2T2.1]